MATKVSISADRSFDVPASKEQVFALIGDVPTSAQNYPALEKLTDVSGAHGANSYQWEMKPISVASITHQVVYGATYTIDEAAGNVKWSPIDGIGNSTIAGSWTVTENANGCTMAFNTSVELAVPVPRMMKSVAAPFAKKEFGEQLDKYLANIQAALS